ncbi:MAG: hypothetical protein IJA20_09545 [Methanocorpusculum sp.]|nr:hypothetical protein [Methanocorpusculum sp.]
MRESGKYKLLEAERKRERHQNPASSPTNLSGGNYHHLPVLDIVLKNIKNQYLWRCVVWHMPFMHRGTYQI